MYFNIFTLSPRGRGEGEGEYSNFFTASLSSREEKDIEFPIKKKLMDLLNGLQVQYSGEIYRLYEGKYTKRAGNIKKN